VERRAPRPATLRSPVFFCVPRGSIVSCSFRKSALLTSRLVGFDDFRSADLLGNRNFFVSPLAGAQSALRQHHPKQYQTVNRAGDQELLRRKLYQLTPDLHKVSVCSQL
jgi:hypothetical protein